MNLHDIKELVTGWLEALVHPDNPEVIDLTRTIDKKSEPEAAAAQVNSMADDYVAINLHTQTSLYGTYSVCCIACACMSKYTGRYKKERIRGHTSHCNGYG